jgi:hypothetical protein
MAPLSLAAKNSAHTAAAVSVPEPVLGYPRRGILSNVRYVSLGCGLRAISTGPPPWPGSMLPSLQGRTLLRRGARPPAGDHVFMRGAGNRAPPAERVRLFPGNTQPPGPELR